MTPSGAVRILIRSPFFASGGGEPPPRPPRPGAGSGEAPLATRPRLLVVEDDAFIGLEIEDILLGAGYEVVQIAVSADEAVKAAIAARPDLVLMDIRLLGPRDGVDAALEIRRRADIDCLFVSAHDDAPVRARAEAARPVGWLSKPFSPPQLLSAVAQALRGAG